MPLSFWGFKPTATLYNNLVNYGVKNYIDWIISDRHRWTYEKFKNNASLICPVWNNETIRQSLYSLPYGDELILFCVCTLCSLSFHSVEKVKQMCEDIEKRTYDSTIIIQRWIKKIIYKPSNINFVLKMRKETW